MGNIAVGDVTQIRCKMRDDDNSLIENTYFIHNSGLAVVADATFMTAIEVLMSSIYEGLDAFMPTSLNPVEIECDAVMFSGGSLVTVRPVGAIAWTTWPGGESPAELLPAFVSASITFPTAIPRVSGRKSFGTFTTSANEGGDMQVTLLLALQLFGGTYLTTQVIDGQDFDFGIMSKKAALFVAPDSFVINPLLGHQVTRKPGRGA